MISSQKTFPMEKVKDDGFFEVVIPDQKLPLTYLLKTLHYDGSSAIRRFVFFSHHPVRI